MKTMSELYRGYEITWKIVVSPKGLKDDNGVSPTVRFWTPRGQPQDKMLIYSPKIALSAKYVPKRYDDPEEYQNHESLNLPINMVYTFANRIRSVYQALADPKMFHKDANGNIIMDKNLAIQNSKKMSLYNANLVIMPAVVYYGDSQGYGAVISMGGKPVGRMMHFEMKELCELIDHLDFQVYSILLSVLEKNCEIDDKLTRLQGDVSEILSILKCGNKMEVQLPKRDPNGLTWQQVQNQREGDFLL